MSEQRIKRFLIMSDRGTIKKIGALAMTAGCFDIILTEFRLTEDVKDQETFIPGFKIFRSDKVRRN